MKKNIVLIGMMGSGKSALGCRLAEELDRPFVDMDAYIESRWGDIPTLFLEGEDYFRDVESQAVVSIARGEHQVIATGGGVILREANMLRLKAKGGVYFIDRPLSHLMQDVDTSHRPLLQEGKEKLIAIHEARIDLYRSYADHIIVNDGSEEMGYQRLVQAVKEDEA